MSTPQTNTNTFLSSEHASSNDIQQQWDQNNQQWWDWYMSLAENSAETQTDLVTLPELPSHPIPDPEAMRRELDQAFELSTEQIESFRNHSFIKLKDVLSPGLLTLMRQELASLLNAAGDHLGSRFGSLEMMWPENEMIRALVFSKRLARMAAELLGVDKIRLYHDNALSKQPGCGRTPWHYDGHHFPIATRDVCTVWIPLQAIPLNMGPLGFAHGMDLVDVVADIPFNKFDTSYDARIIKRFRDRNIRINSSPFDLGEISFHHNYNFHTAGGNLTTTPRMVLATTYFGDGARVIDAPHMVNGDWQRFMPGLEPGDVIDTPNNPILYSNVSGT
ncbi:phytanoyl-CoA dioxygenase family protein [bacterium]|nr:phytanoyl-CoA dioxygenase family protein [bacterium]